MTRKTKSGNNILIGNAGEYYVIAELLKRGVIAALAPVNTPSFDILATKGEKFVRIRVKTKSQELSIWQYSVKKNGNILNDILKEGDFTVLVDLSMKTEDLKFYVVATYQIDSWLKEDFKIWLNTPGKNGEPHSMTSPKRILSYKLHAEELNDYLNQWESLWK